MMNRMKHGKRYQEIINTFIKNGFSHFLFRIGLTDRDSAEKDPIVGDANLTDIGEKLRHTLQDLGPSFIKLGQIASTRRDLIPEEIAIELEKLQDDVQSFSYEEVKTVIEDELNKPIELAFASFNKTPLATASIGQVHEATLPSGEEVAVKIQRPDIQPIIETDLSILRNLARLLESRFSLARTYKLVDIIEEFSFSLLNELDYELEGRNGERMKKQLRENPFVHAPIIYWEQTTKKVLTMEKISGIKISDYDQLIEKGHDPKLLAERLTETMLQQILEDGFFHGDPHSGNIFVQPYNEITFLDFGMVGRLDDDLKIHFSSLVIHLQSGNTDGMLETFDKWELTNNVENRRSLRRDLDFLQVRYYDVPLQQISLGKVIADIFSIAYKHNVEIPSDIAILGKVILTLETIIEQLDPDFSIMKAIEPYGKKLLMEQLHPKNIARESWKRLVENMEYIANLPKNFTELASTIKKGKLHLDINIEDVQQVLERLDRISNRLSFSIILLSFSILMVGLIIGASIVGQTTLLWRIPVIEIGSVVATLMFILMLFTIFRSGRM